MRTNLHIHFHCSNCGRLLRTPMKHEAAKENGGIQVNTHKQHGDSTPEPGAGAFVNGVDILIEPCVHCIERETGPAKRLAKAVAELTK